MSSIRMAAGIQPVGTDESFGLSMDFKRLAAVLGNPTSIISCTLFDETANQDVSSTKLSGSTTLSGTVAVGKRMSGLELGHNYQYNILVAFPNDLAGNAVQRSGYVKLKAER